MTAAGIDPEVLRRLEDLLHVFGRVPRAQVLDALKSTDFTNLMRSPEQRYARAGFPTKVVESLSNSTPVICNLTSDLGRYLRDGENSLLVEDCTPEALARVLAKAVALTQEQRAAMQARALASAEADFLDTGYLDVLDGLCR